MKKHITALLLIGTTIIAHPPKRDTLIVLKLSDYRRQQQIIYNLHRPLNDAEKLRIDLETRDINKRVRFIIDTGKVDKH